MKKKEVKKEFPLFVRKSHEYKGIVVYYEIDFIKEQVSLVEKDGTKKQWYFNDREREYCKTWINIMEAMKQATEKAIKELEEYRENKIIDALEIWEGV